MKVIVASYGKTGTKTVAAALQELGYSVLDFPDHFIVHGEEWKKILTGKGSVDDFRKMYEDVDAVCDAPSYYFWEEILQVFPESKMILMLRDEDQWYNSLVNHLNALATHKDYTRVEKYSQGFRRFTAVLNEYLRETCGSPEITKWGEIKEKLTGQTRYDLCPMLMKKRLRQHNANVLMNAPKDKLLLFNLKEEWKPLCEFLNKPIPAKSFPRKNVNHSLLDDLFKENKSFIKFKKEADFNIKCIIFLTTLFLAIVLYFLISQYKMF